MVSPTKYLFGLVIAFSTLLWSASVVCAQNNSKGANDSRYFELRDYEILEGKMEAVLARFHDHVDPLFKKHGFVPVGYWTAIDKAKKERFLYILSAPNKEQFEKSSKAFGNDPDFKAAYAASEKEHGKTVEHIHAYPLNALEWSPLIAPAANSANRAFELRVYSMVPEKSGIYLESYRNHRLRLFQKHGFTNLGYWVGTENKPATFVMLLAHQAPELIDKSKSAYHADPEWKVNIDEALKSQGALTTDVVSYTMKPASFSPWK